ncbi:unnamed protein product [Tilletia caries]|nr:unnamed protein product [Tilletia caries]
MAPKKRGADDSSGPGSSGAGSGKRRIKVIMKKAETTETSQPEARAEGSSTDQGALSYVLQRDTATSSRRPKKNKKPNIASPRNMLRLYRQTAQLGAQRRIPLTESTSRKQFLDLLEGRCALLLAGTAKDWTISFHVSGHSIFNKLTEIDFTDEGAAHDYQSFMSALAENSSGTVKFAGSRNTAAAKDQGAQNTAKEQMEQRLDQFSPTIKDAFVAIWTANRCGDSQCGQKSILFPACWPLPGGVNHLNLTVESTQLWAFALSEKRRGVTASSSPPVHPYAPEFSMAKLESGVKVESDKGKGRKLDGKGNKENEPIILSQDSSASDVKFVSQKLLTHYGTDTDTNTQQKKKKSGVADNAATNTEQKNSKKDSDVADNAAAKPLSEPQLPIWGTFMQLDEFGAAFNLHNDVVELLRKFGADSASEVAEMEPSNFSEAGINSSQRLKIKTALKKWRMAALAGNQGTSSIIAASLTSTGASNIAGPSTFPGAHKDSGPSAPQS